jgi:hypothetical protein
VARRAAPRAIGDPGKTGPGRRSSCTTEGDRARSGLGITSARRGTGGTQRQYRGRTKAERQSSPTLRGWKCPGGRGPSTRIARARCSSSSSTKQRHRGSEDR